MSPKDSTLELTLKTADRSVFNDLPVSAQELLLCKDPGLLEPF